MPLVPILHVATAFLAFASTSAQASERGAATDLPRLPHLGPLPPDAPVLSLRADGALFDGADLAAPRDNERTDLVLRVDRAAPAAVVVALLDRARARGYRVAHFAANLPDGTLGGFGLALPHDDPAPPTLALRAHRERPGIPPGSVTPFLRRLCAGAADAAPFVLSVDVPGDATCEQMLRLLGAVAEAGVRGVAVSSTWTPTQRALAARDLDLRVLATASPVAVTPAALDLGPFPRFLVPPSAPPAARPHLHPDPYGCLARAGAGAVPDARGGIRRGRGGRVGLAAAVEHGGSWVGRQQRPDGAFPDPKGEADLSATSLVTLMLAADGASLDAGAHAEVLRGAVGWLLGQQRGEGRLGGDDAIRAHALATWALAEAAGTSPTGVLLRGGVQDALDWMFAQRRRDGGWGEAAGGPRSDAASTALCLQALATGEEFGFRVPASAHDVAAWFVRGDPAPSPLVTAASLDSLLRTGRQPPPEAAARLLRETDRTDPWGTFWTTQALYRLGGPDWDAWSRHLTNAVVATQVNQGDEKGTWDPTGPDSRVVTTALRVLTLQMYYRYSRLVR